MTDRRGHMPEIDWLKGVAVLCVICIHAELLKGTFAFRELIERAVMIFMVLFGISSELWFQRQPADRRGVLRDRYVHRLSRLLLGYWLLIAVTRLLTRTPGDERGK